MKATLLLACCLLCACTRSAPTATAPAAPVETPLQRAQRQWDEPRERYENQPVEPSYANY